MISKKHFIKNSKNCFCQTPELIENYEQAINDETQTWECHHRDEVKILPSGIEVRRSREELIENGRYYNCPPNELIFLTKAEHTKIHMKDRILSEVQKRKISKTNKGKNHGVRGETKSVFGYKFKERFGITFTDNTALYYREYMWYKNHNKVCSWEAINDSLVCNS